MDIISRLDTIRRRILNAAACSHEYKETWGVEYCSKELAFAFSPEESFGNSKVQIITQEELKSVDRNILYSYGFGNWDGNLILIPLWLVSFMDKSEMVTSIMGTDETLGACDKDVRGGCIAYGFKL
jgi:hypothetical protein